MIATLSYCDCCNKPFVNGFFFRAGVSAAGCDTSACLLCASPHSLPSKDELMEEMVALGEFFPELGVARRIIELGDLVGKTK